MTSRKVRASLVTAIILGSWLGLCGLTGCKHVEVTAADPGPVEAKDWVRVWYHMRYSPILGEDMYTAGRLWRKAYQQTVDDEDCPLEDETDYDAFTERVQFGSYSILRGTKRALLFHEGVPVWAGDYVLPLRASGRVNALCLLTVMPLEQQSAFAMYTRIWLSFDAHEGCGIPRKAWAICPGYMKVWRNGWLSDIDGDGTDELVGLEPKERDLSYTTFSNLTETRWVLCLYGDLENPMEPPPNTLLVVPLPVGVVGCQISLKPQAEPHRGLVVWDGSVRGRSEESPRRLGTIIRDPNTAKWTFVKHQKDEAP